jgi:hypothetical protein
MKEKSATAKTETGIYGTGSKIFALTKTETGRVPIPLFIN